MEYRKLLEEPIPQALIIKYQHITLALGSKAPLTAQQQRGGLCEVVSIHDSVERFEDPLDDDIDWKIHFSQPSVTQLSRVIGVTWVCRSLRGYLALVYHGLRGGVVAEAFIQDGTLYCWFVLGGRAVSRLYGGDPDAAGRDFGLRYRFLV